MDPGDVSRRRFVQSAAVASAGVFAFPAVVNAGNGRKNEVLKIGVVGCGGRGTGAVSQAFAADPDIELWAVADVFEGQVTSSLDNLKARYDKRVRVAPERQFLGLDGYKDLMATDVDVVLLTAPPGFRPAHLAAAVEAGKHVFAEKPMAVDMAGIKSVMASAQLARKKRLNIQHGLCWRFAPAVRAAYQKVLDGELGRLVSVYGTYLANVPKPMTAADERKPEWSDVEWQIRNWMGYEWLSGGPLIEQAVHTVDKISWVMGDVAPLAAVASGGRSQRSDGGDVYDHYNIAYEYPGGVICHVAQRQYRNAHTEVVDRVYGTEGKMIGPSRPMIYNAAGKAIWRYRGQDANMYQIGHDELFAALRKGEVVDSGDLVFSTAVTLLGREAAHSGRRITWEDLMASDADLAPDDLKWDDDHKVSGVPVPGQ